MPFYKTTITPPMRVQDYLRELQAAGIVTEIKANADIEFVYEAEDLWDAATDLKDLVREADANYSVTGESSDYAKATETVDPRLNRRILDVSEVVSLTPAQVIEVSNYLREHGVPAVSPIN